MAMSQIMSGLTKLVIWWNGFSLYWHGPRSVLNTRAWYHKRLVTLPSGHGIWQLVWSYLCALGTGMVLLGGNWLVWLVGWLVTTITFHLLYQGTILVCWPAFHTVQITTSTLMATFGVSLDNDSLHLGQRTTSGCRSVLWRWQMERTRTGDRHGSPQYTAREHARASQGERLIWIRGSLILD